MFGDGSALLAAICENPQEDLPRLIYADWLEENGRPERAEFIRLQCERWSQGSAYPNLAAVRNRASQLLKEFRDWWYEELPRLPGVEWGSLFVRGFIDAAETNRIDDLTETLRHAFAATPLQYLHVTDLVPGQLRELLDCPFLSRLIKLSLPGTLGREESRLLTDARLRFPQTEIS